jgi:hypothetical protein
MGTKPEGMDQNLVIPEMLIYRCYQYFGRNSSETVNLTEKIVRDTDSLVDVGPLDSYPLLIVGNLIVQR